tara:strand:+ start:1616 stop:1852 length:237 start_codon:yes stop_codon:yes gene_type:complete
MKYILILHLCSMLNNTCSSQSIPGYQFKSHYDCIDAGYAISQQTFRNLETFEQFNKEYIDQSKTVIKFECKEIKTEGV